MNVMKSVALVLSTLVIAVSFAAPSFAAFRHRPINPHARAAQAARIANAPHARPAILSIRRHRR
jgi:hypothetical protein